MNATYPTVSSRLRLTKQSALCALTHHGLGVSLLVCATMLGMMGWQQLIWLVCGDVMALATLLAMVRNQTMRIDHDPALLAPFAFMAIAVTGTAWALAEQPFRTLLAASLAPIMALSCIRIRRGFLRSALIPTWTLGCHALLWLGMVTHIDSGLACALSLFLLTPLLALVLHQQAHVASSQALCTWLLSSEQKQRLLLGRSLVASANAVVGLTALEYGASQGMNSAEPTRWLTVSGITATVLIYLYTRAGLNKSWRDPSMTEPKLILVVTFLAVGYYLGDMGRDIALILLVTLEMFGMFVITPTQVLRISVYATIAFGMSMFMVAATDTGVWQARLQTVHFVVMLIILGTISWLANQLAIMRNALRARKDALSEALDRIQILATHDDLTGLINRRHMVDLMETQFKRRARTGNEVCLALLDLDHFKQINDTHGHGVGDEVLRSFALAMKASLRNSDIPARWGGEEFMLLFDDTNIETARLTLERARLEVSRMSLSDSVPGLRVTFSCGLTESLPGEALEHTVDRADQALYAAKAAGRDRVVTRSERLALIRQNSAEKGTPLQSVKAERSGAA
jgi:diguanylate cyclase (GGDEF)-like protein